MTELTPVLVDAATLRTKIHDRVSKAVENVFPVDLRGRTLTIEDVKVHRREFGPEEQKKALLAGSTLQEPVKGTVVLREGGPDGKVIDRAENFSLVHVPYLTERHTIIADGNEYQVANQLRRKPGVYTQRAENGELKTVFNLGRGQNFDLGFNEAKGTFALQYGGSNIPLYPVLRGLGVSHADIASHLGPGVAKQNEAEHGHQVEKAISSLYEKLEHASAYNPKLPFEQKLDVIRKRYGVTTLDPEVTQHTLGHAFTGVTPVVFMRAAKKIVDVHAGRDVVDDTDSLTFKTFHALDGFLAERIALVARDWKGKARLALQGKQKIREGLKPSPFSDSVRKFVTTSALAAVPSGINPMELIDHSVKVTALGEGGIPSDRAIPVDARMMHSTHFGALDPIRTPESNHAGVDIRATILAHRDDHGNLFTTVHGVKSGKVEFLKAGDLLRAVVAFPHHELKGKVPAFIKGKVELVDAKDVTHQMLHVSHQYSPATSLLPFIRSMQGNRAIMASKMGTQALPLLDREAPFVQVKSPFSDGVSFEALYGHQIVPRATVSGTVTKIEDGYVHIRPDGVKKAEVYAEWDDETGELLKTAASDGTVKVPFQTYFPFPSKTALHHELDVKVGDKVKEGERLGDSNFTRKGVLALGKNLRVAYMPYYGMNSNDAVVISEGCAKKLTSEHVYREVFPITSQVEMSKAKHKVFFGPRYSPAQYAKLDDKGVIKAGSRVNPKDPLVVGLVKTQILGNDLLLGQISKALTTPYREVALLWEHGTPGEVLEVHVSSGQVAILVRTEEQMQVGDKLCYDEKTEVLTENGWKYFFEVKMDERVATLNGDELEYHFPSATHTYAEGGRMYNLQSQQVDLLVTEGHKMVVQARNDTAYKLVPARDVYGKRVRYRKSATWSKGIDAPVHFDPITVLAGQGGRGTREIPGFYIPATAYAAILGAFISEGNCIDDPKSGSYGICITQIKSPNREQLLELLTRLAIPFSEGSNGTKVTIYSKQLLQHFKQFGYSYQKYLPNFVFGWTKTTQQILFKWLMWGDGHTNPDSRLPVSYATTSPQLADDVQRLALHVGISANVQSSHKRIQEIKGRTSICRRRYDVRFVTTKCFPEVNHGHAKTQSGQSEAWIEDYAGPVYGLTVPHGVVYVRRNGKAVWSGNSGRHGNKGVVSKIVPDHEMIQDEQGRPIDLLLTSAGVISRINPSQIHETILGKVVEKTGVPIAYDNASHENADEYVDKLCRLHGVNPLETVYDPVLKRKIKGGDGKGVHVGRQFIYKLFKSTDTNFSGHGVGPYDVNEQPLKTGGDDSAKGLGKMEFDALVAHNARSYLQEAASIKSQKNDDFWRALQTGAPLPAPKPTFAFNKLVAMLEGAGVKIEKRDSKLKLLPMTDRDILKRSSGVIENKKTLVAKNLKPETGGLFDPAKTGGAQGTLYSHISLHERMPNPVFVEPIRRLLKLSQKEFDQHVHDSGGQGIYERLKALDVDEKLKEQTERMRKASGTELDDAVKQIKYLRALKTEGLRPHEAYTLSHVPVIPPVFRPILPQPNNPGELMVSDANKLYAHLLDANEVLKSTALDSDRGKHRQLVYNAVGAVFGTHEAADEKLQKQQVKGFLQNIAGVGTPKGGFFQRKLMRRTQDISGRGTAVPDVNLGMDEVGVPEEMLWKMLDKQIVARLVRQGYPALIARELVDQRKPVAREAMVAESKEAPVLINRAPTLHRWSIIAAYPKIVQGKTLRISPFIEKGMNLDFDGDTLQVHRPVTAPAIAEARKMTLSNMVFGDQQRNKLLAFPQHEAVIGFTHASQAKPTGPVKHFKNREEVLAAYRAGTIQLTDAIVVDDG